MRLLSTCAWIFVIFLLGSCNSSSSGKRAYTDAIPSKIIDHSMSFSEFPEQIDSLQILYYDNPDGDSVRYTRFFSYTTTRDSILWSQLFEDLKKAADTLQEIRKCRSQGKIYLYAAGKPDEPVKTVFFSIRGDSCSYLYYIKNGAFIYGNISEAVKERVRMLKNESLKP